MAVIQRPWAPAPDDALWWFRPGGIFPARPRPLDFTLELFAETSGLTRGLILLNFPLYQIRPRLIDGELYVASVPSGIAERDPQSKLGLMRDSSLRYTRNPRGPWEQTIRQKVEGWNSWMAEALPDSSAELAERLRELRKVREMQWFLTDRGAVGTVALLRKRLQELPAESEDRAKIAAAVEEGTGVLHEAMALVRDQGGAHLKAFVEGTAKRLVEMDVLDAIDDVYWLGWREVRQALTETGDWKARAAEKKAATLALRDRPVSEEIGPRPAPDALHMHLVREVLALLAA
ncbi:MAG TPA: hypothetical protein VGK54_00350 [Chloroflexota bacterium]|jgi:hypothetical protein